MEKIEKLRQKKLKKQQLSTDNSEDCAGEGNTAYTTPSETDGTEGEFTLQEEEGTDSRVSER